MFDTNSFETESFNQDSWLFEIIEVIRRGVKRVVKMPQKYLIFPRFKLGK